MKCGVCYFNSIKVRLELDLSMRKLFTAKVFQFHKGTIRTHLRNQAIAWICNFNSIKVRLEHFAKLGAG